MIQTTRSYCQASTLRCAGGHLLGSFVVTLVSCTHVFSVHALVSPDCIVAVCLRMTEAVTSVKSPLQTFVKVALKNIERTTLCSTVTHFSVERIRCLFTEIRAAGKALYLAVPALHPLKRRKDAARDWTAMNTDNIHHMWYLSTRE